MLEFYPKNTIFPDYPVHYSSYECIKIINTVFRIRQADSELRVTYRVKEGSKGEGGGINGLRLAQ